MTKVECPRCGWISQDKYQEIEIAFTEIEPNVQVPFDPAGPIPGTYCVMSPNNLQPVSQLDSSFKEILSSEPVIKKSGKKCK